MTTTTTESLARRVYEDVDAGLAQDAYTGLARAARQLVDWLHRARWTSPQARDRGLRRLIVAALGSRGKVDESGFAYCVTRLAIQTCVPTALRAAAQCHEGEQKARLLHLADLCEREPTRNNALQACAAYADCAANYSNLGIPAADVACYAAFATACAADAARAAEAAVDTAAYAAAHATDAVVPFAAYAALHATDAATYAAYAATYAADAAYTAAYAGNSAPNDVAAGASYDDTLAAFAERVARVLIDLNSPGAAYLPKCDGV